MPRSLRDSVVLITGASAGIGRALAVELHCAGAKLALAARRLDRLDAINVELGGGHLCLKADVAASADCDAIVARTVERFGRLDTLVCNAGYGLVRRVDAMSDAEFLEILQTNVLGTMACMRAAVPELRRNDVRDGYRGQIVIVSSAAARRGLPYFGAYSATKAAQLSIAEAARVELRRDRIAVTSVHPIGTDTDFFTTAESTSGAKIDVPGRAGGFRQTGEHVARKIVRAMRKPKPEVWPHGPSRLALSLATLLPSIGDRLMTRSVRELDAHARSAATACSSSSDAGASGPSPAR